MKMNKKLMALLLTASMGMTMLAGCGNDDAGSTQDNSADISSNTQDSSDDASGSSTAGEDADASAGEDNASEENNDFDTSEHVVLTMYCIGDEGGIYAQEHLDKLNALLTEKINAEIEPIMVSWGDYKTKLPMVWASGETYDLTFAGNWVSYFAEGSKGAFMDITELFPVYAPETYAELAALDKLDSTRIGGKLYLVPNNIPDYTTFIWNYREDLRKKYNCPEIVDMETFEIFLQAIKDNEPGMMPVGNAGTEAMFFHTWLNEMDWARPIEYNNAGVFAYELKDPTKVFNLVDTPEYEAYVKKCREYYEKGYWSQSILAENPGSTENFRAGKVAASPQNFSNSNGSYQGFQSSNPDWEIGLFSSDMLSGTVESVAASGGGVCVGAYSKNPERALMFVELCYQDREVYDVLMNGLEGITYEADREAGTKWIPEGTDPSTISLKNLGMGFGTQKFYLGSLNDSPTVNELKEAYSEISVFPELAGFAINQDPIAAELAALKSVCDEYKVPLEKGVVDPESGLAELREKLDAAGLEKVLEELNRQISEYLGQ